MSEPGKEEPPIKFTPTELAEQTKTIGMIQNNFLRNHIEITSTSNSPLASLLREEKIMYSNLAISFCVTAMAALAKRGKV